MSIKTDTPRTEILATLKQQIRNFKRLVAVSAAGYNRSAEMIATEAIATLEQVMAYINNTSPQPGDYVLATKYKDGDPHDQWAVGFYLGLTALHYDGERFDVVDGNGGYFRGNGFRRIAVISKARGQWILDHAKEIELSGKSLWEYVDCPMDDPLVPEPSIMLHARCGRNPVDPRTMECVACKVPVHIDECYRLGLKAEWLATRPHVLPFVINPPSS